MRHRLTTLLLTAAFALAGAAHAEELYRWVDAAGTVHFGPNPPKGVEAALVSIQPPPPGAGVDAPPAADAAPEGTDKSPGQLAREERAMQRKEQAADKADREAKCTAMRERLAAVEPHTRVIVQEQDGEVRRLEDQERMDLIAESRSYIEKNCD